jgi:hypothetical protein
MKLCIICQERKARRGSEFCVGCFSANRDDMNFVAVSVNREDAVFFDQLNRQFDPKDLLGNELNFTFEPTIVAKQLFKYPEQSAKELNQEELIRLRIRRKRISIYSEFVNAGIPLSKVNITKDDVPSHQSMLSSP